MARPSLLCPRHFFMLGLPACCLPPACLPPPACLSCRASLLVTEGHRHVVPSAQLAIASERSSPSA
eukprot:10499242-Alexandrium_andersonii.AAC.1